MQKQQSTAAGITGKRKVVKKQKLKIISSYFRGVYSEINRKAGETGQTKALTVCVEDFGTTTGQALGPGGGGVVSGPAGALAQFRAMSGQLEVHQGSLCTAPVSPNLCSHGPYAPAARATAHGKR